MFPFELLLQTHDLIGLRYGGSLIDPLAREQLAQLLRGSLQLPL